MNSSGKSFFFPNSLGSSSPSLEEYTKHLPLTSLPNTTDYPAPEIQSSNFGVEGSNVDAEISETSINKPQGQPRDTKNKFKADPKNESPMKVVVLEIPPGADIIQWVKNIANSKQLCVTVLNGFGSIYFVDVHNEALGFQPMRIMGPLTLISLSGTFMCSSPLPTSSSSSSSSSSPPSFSLISTNSFTALLTRFDGKLFGVEPLKMVSKTPVILTLATFSKPEIYNKF